MKFDENPCVRKVGRIAGFSAGFLVFSTMAYLILKHLNKIPDHITYHHVLIIVIIVSIWYVIKILKRYPN